MNETDPFSHKRALFSAKKTKTQNITAVLKTVLLAAVLSILLLLAAFISTSLAQKIRFSTVQMGENAPTRVHAVSQDSLGFLWLATDEGLARFDGKKLRYFRFDALDSTSLGANLVWDVKVDRRQRVWAATSNAGISVLDPKTEQFRRFNPENNDSSTRLSGVSVPTLSETSSGDMLAGVWNSGVNRISANNVQMWEARKDPKNSGITGGNVRFVFEDPQKTIWAITHRSVAFKTLDSEHFVTAFSIPDSLRMVNSYFNSVAKRSHSEWILGTRKNAIWILNTELRTVERWINHPFFEEITAVSGFGGDVWVGTFSKGLFRFDTKRNVWSRFSSSDKLPFSLKMSSIETLFQDNQGQLWVFGPENFAQVYRPDRFFFDLISTKTHAAPIEFVSAVYETDHAVWIGTERNGLWKMDLKTGVFQEISPIGSRHIHALEAGFDHDIWVGTSAGLERFEVNTGKKLIPPDGFFSPNLAVTALLMDSKNRFWIGTQGDGLWRINSFQTEKPEPFKELSGGFIWDVKEASDGSVWAAAWGGGVFVFEKDGQITELRQEKGDLVSNAAISLAEIGSNMVIGTWGDGFSVIDRTSRKTIQHAPPGSIIPNGFVFGILPENEHVWWVATTSGLFRVFNEQKKYQQFGEIDGLQSKTGILNAVHQGKSGWFYAGGPGGLNRFLPNEILSEEKVGNIVFTGFEINGRPVPYGRIVSESTEKVQKSIAIKPNEPLFTVSVAHTDMRAPIETEIRYRVKEFQSAWSPVNNNGSIVFTGLRPGRYTLELEASRRNALGNSVHETLELIIEAPFWRKPLFWIVLAGLFVGFVAFFARFYIRSRLAVERTRTEIARDLHDELGGSLSGITNLISAAEKLLERGQLEKTAHYLVQSLGKARQLQESMYEVIWAVNPGNDSWQSFLDRVREFLLNAVSGTEMQPEFDISGDVFPDDIPLLLRKNLWLMIKEMVHNALKHSGASRVLVRFEFGAKTLKISLSDNGSGFEPNHLKTGNGLVNLTQRAKATGLKLELETSSFGTTWRIEYERPQQSFSGL